MKRDSRGFGAMIAFEVDDHALVEQVLLKTQLISFAESLGGVESLITFPEVQTHADIPPETAGAAGHQQRPAAPVGGHRGCRRPDRRPAPCAGSIGRKQHENRDQTDPRRTDRRSPDRCAGGADLPDFDLSADLGRPLQEVRLRPGGQPDPRGTGGYDRRTGRRHALPGLLLRDGGHLHDPDDLLPRRPSGGLRRCLRRRLPGALDDLQPHGDQLHLCGRHRSGGHRICHQAGNQGDLPGDHPPIRC